MRSKDFKHPAAVCGCELGWAARESDSRGLEVERCDDCGALKDDTEALLFVLVRLWLVLSNGDMDVDAEQDLSHAMAKWASKWVHGDEEVEV